MEYHIARMSCDGCVATIADTLKALDGASQVTPDLERKTIAIKTSARLTDVEKALAAAGYPVTPR
jgi:copper chaperone CopZ